MPTNSDLHLDLLDRIRIASPCPMKWDDLEGDGAVRYCGECRLNVHNLAEMTPREIETLIAEHEGRLCVSLYRRADGTILTKDCPVGLRAVPARTAKMVARVAAAFALLITGGVVLGRGREGGSLFEYARLRSAQPFAALSEWLDPLAPPAPLRVRGRMAMGVVMVAPQPGNTNAPPPGPPDACDDGGGS